MAFVLFRATALMVALKFNTFFMSVSTDMLTTVVPPSHVMGGVVEDFEVAGCGDLGAWSSRQPGSSEFHAPEPSPGGWGSISCPYDFRSAA